MAEAVPTAVVEEDHRLDAERRRTAGDLAQLRWHWTDDESNPDRVSYSAYARAVGKTDTTIRGYARGWQRFLDEQSSDRTSAPLEQRSMTDHIEMARTTERRRQAAQAIADAEGQRVAHVLKNRHRDVTAVVATAEERAERLGTTPDEEIDRTVSARKIARDAERSAEQRRRAARTAAYLSIEGRVAAARRQLSSVLTDAEGVDFTDEETELIRDSMRMLQALLHLIDSRFAGTPDVDWDSELQRITGGAA